MIVWANLDCEARWAGVTLPQHVLARISAASALLAALAPDGEPVEIYAPAPVDPARVKLPNVTMKVGTPPRYDLAWADPSAKAVNDRWFGLALAERLGVALPGARTIASLDELDAHLATLGGRAWVVKARWTAAGRDRAHGRGALDPTAGPRVAELRTYVSRLIDRGGVVVEPWMDRVLDLGWCSGASEPHVLAVDERGGFQGIELMSPAPQPELERVLREAQGALAGAGYTGPYAVDAFVYRDGDDKKIHALCELNARHTFGHVAHALRTRFGASRLGFSPPPEGAHVLVDDPIAPAWIHD